jgi:ubiquinone biosynthesis protein UbiJ
VTTALDYPLVKLFNRVLSDYPMAREQLAKHAGKTIAASVGPLDCRLRVTAEGTTELVGEGGEFSADVTFQVPLSLLPRLMQREESAYPEVVFSGDSEFAALLSTLAREMKWDIEEDLSRLVGDIAAHRIVDTASRAHAWQRDSAQRFTENVAEYLTEERRAFITKSDLETLALANETLRDDVARLEARLRKLAAGLDPK